MIGDGRLDRLSIGFLARDWSRRVARGRNLKRIELREVSLVTAPMLRQWWFGVPWDAITTRARRTV